MKTKDLIAMLQKEDPSGEVEVCVNNHDIYFAEMMEAYWDGKLQLIVRDESKKPYYHIVGAKVVATGAKIKLHTMGVEDIIENDPDIPVDLSDLEKHSPYSYGDWKKRVEDWRKETKRIDAEVQQKIHEMKGK